MKINFTFKEEVIDFLKSLDMSDEESRKFIDNWRNAIAQRTIEEVRENQVFKIKEDD